DIYRDALTELDTSPAPPPPNPDPTPKPKKEEGKKGVVTMKDMANEYLTRAEATDVSRKHLLTMFGDKYVDPFEVTRAFSTLNLAQGNPKAEVFGIAPETLAFPVMMFLPSMRWITVFAALDVTGNA